MAKNMTILVTKSSHPDYDLFANVKIDFEREVSIRGDREMIDRFTAWAMGLALDMEMTFILTDDSLTAN